MTPLFCALNALTAAVTSPPVSLPMQTVTSPLAFSIDARSMVFAPSVAPVSSACGAPPPPSSSSPPQPPRARPSGRRSRAIRRHVGSVLTEPLLLFGLVTGFAVRPYPSFGSPQLQRGRRAPLDDLEWHPAAGDRFAGQCAQQQAGAEAADLLQRLRDRGEARVAGRLHVVEADDRELPGTDNPTACAASSTPIAWTSEAGEDGRGPVLARQQLGARRRVRRRARAAGAGSSPAAAAARRRRAPPRTPRAGGRWSRSRTGSPPRRPGRRARGGRAPAGARPPSCRPRCRRS